MYPKKRDKIFDKRKFLPWERRKNSIYCFGKYRIGKEKNIELLQGRAIKKGKKEEKVGEIREKKIDTVHKTNEVQIKKMDRKLMKVTNNYKHELSNLKKYEKNDFKTQKNMCKLSLMKWLLRIIRWFKMIRW